MRGVRADVVWLRALWPASGTCSPVQTLTPDESGASGKPGSAGPAPFRPGAPSGRPVATEPFPGDAPAAGEARPAAPAKPAPTPAAPVAPAPVAPATPSAAAAPADSSASPLEPTTPAESEPAAKATLPAVNTEEDERFLTELLPPDAPSSRRVVTTLLRSILADRTHS